MVKCNDKEPLQMPDPKLLSKQQNKFWCGSLSNLTKGRRMYRRFNNCKKFKSTLYFEIDNVMCLKKIQNYFYTAIYNFEKMNTAIVTQHINYCNLKINDISLKIAEITLEDDCSTTEDENDLYD